MPSYERFQNKFYKINTTLSLDHQTETSTKTQGNKFDTGSELIESFNAALWPKPTE